MGVPVATPAASMQQWVLDAVKPNVTPSQYLHDGGENADGTAKNETLILFIHGIFGDTKTTWQREGAPSMSDFLIKTNGFERGYDTYAFGFPSTFVKTGSFSINEAAKSLQLDWESLRFGSKYKTVVIVAHSMGGLVAINALTLFRDMQTKVPLIISYATPYQGSQVAEIAERFIRNPGLPGMKRGESNQMLAALIDQWKQNRGTTRISCAYEKVEVPAIGLIVQPDSAQALCDKPAPAIVEDHISIVKPTSQNHPSMKLLVNELRRLKPPGQTLNDRQERIAVLDGHSEMSVPKVKGVTTKLARGVAELLNSNGHSVTLSSGATPGKHVFEISGSVLSGGNISISVSLKNPSNEYLGSAELVGSLTELELLQSGLPDAMLYALDINIRNLKKKNSAKRPTTEPLAYAAYVLAGRRLDARLPQQAEQLLAKALSQDPSFAMASWALGEIAKSRGDGATAEKYYAAARRIDADHPRIPLAAAGSQENMLPDLLNVLRQARSIPAFKPSAKYVHAESEAFRIAIHAWTFPRSDWKLEVVEQLAADGSTAHQLLPKDSNYVLAMNAGYFHQNANRLTPSGLLVAGGVVKNRVVNNRLSAALFESDTGIDVNFLSAVKKPVDSYPLLMQAGPMLVDAPGVNGISADSQFADRANRSAICVTEKDVTFLAVVGADGFGVTLRDLAAVLAEQEASGGFQCTRALNLDGGWSTQVAYREGSVIRKIGSMRKVRNVLVVRRKAAIG